MTISSTQTIFMYNCDGTTTNFAYPSVFFVPADLVVQLFNAGIPVLPQPVLGGSGVNDYTLSGTQDPNSGEYLSGASIVFGTAPSASYQLVITLAMQPTQNTSLNNNSLFPAKALEAALDRQALLIQQLLNGGANSIQFPATDPPGLIRVLPPVATRSSQVVGFDGLGNVTTYNLSEAGAANVLDISGSNYFAVDNSFNPPLITQAAFWEGVAPANGNVVATIYFPTYFPNRAINITVVASFDTPAGWASESLGTGGDQRTYVQYSVYGAAPGTLVLLSLLVIGY